MSDRVFPNSLLKTKEEKSSLVLDNGSRVAVIGGGPAGSFFSYFLLDMAERKDLDIQVDIYEPRDFDVPGPAGCNMCGGVIYESLIQNLAVEGINLPTTVVQRGIEFNRLHLDIGSAQIQTPQHEKRIATTFRGAGPKDLLEIDGNGLDNFLIQAAVSKGARHIRSRVQKVEWTDSTDISDTEERLLRIKTKSEEDQTYKFLAVTTGVNTSLLKSFQNLDIGYQPPQTTKLLVREYQLGEELVSQYLGPVFHAFLLDIPGLDYGAIIPKGKYATVCLLSSRGDLDPEVMDIFLNDPAVKRILPPDFSSASLACHCSPRINVMGCAQPYGDQFVFIGDSGVSRLYKDGIGAAYRSAKIAASTAIFQGISKDDFKKHFQPMCRKVQIDNKIGKFLFRIINQIQKMQFARQAVLQMVSSEQQGKANPNRGLSTLMWDMLTGGAPYKEVLLRALHPEFWTRFISNLAISLFSRNNKQPKAESSVGSHQLFSPELPVIEDDKMNIGELGKIYQEGEIIVRQGEPGDCMYVVQEGSVEVIFESEGQQVQLNKLGKDDFFGEMAIFNQEVRTATVRAIDQARIITVNHKNLLKFIHEDPSLAYRLMEEMSKRIDNLSEAVAQLSQSSPE